MIMIKPLDQYGPFGSVIELLRQLAVFEKMEGGFEPDEDCLRTHLESSINPLHIYLACDGLKPVGVVVFYVGQYSTFKSRWRVYLEDIYVAKEYRGQGLLRRLLQPVALHALQAGHTEVAFSVLDWNKNAQAAYQALGAEVEGHYVERAGQTWLRMVFRGEALEALAAG